MTREEIRALPDRDLDAAIVKALGIEDELREKFIRDTQQIADALGMSLDEEFHNMDCSPDGYPVPEFSKDLNVIHETELALTEDQLHRYILKLLYRDGESSKWGPAIVATARQRAEALLMVLTEQ